MIMAWYPWHDCIGTSLVIYFDVRFQISGGLINQGQTPSRVQAFWTLSDFFPALHYNRYSYKQLLFRTIKVFQQTLRNWRNWRNLMYGQKVFNYLRSKKERNCCSLFPKFTQYLCIRHFMQFSDFVVLTTYKGRYWYKFNKILSKFI